MKTWRERVAEARVRGSFTKEDFKLVHSWVTCAVGEQRRLVGPKIIPYERSHLAYHDGSGLCPLDELLRHEGEIFAYAVMDNKFDLAEEALASIEECVLQLKREA